MRVSATCLLLKLQELASFCQKKWNVMEVKEDKVFLLILVFDFGVCVCVCLITVNSKYSTSMTAKSL